jgi:phosphoenolpyruvate-protein kinase (PTS system EI component)
MRALSGEIVVPSAIEPSVTPLFPVVGGVIAEIGGVLSHAAILAREYGVPAVVNVKDATRRLRDGDRMQLNGATGRIRVLGCSTRPATVTRRWRSVTEATTRPISAPATTSDA